MIIDLLITIWNFLYSIIMFTISLPVKLINWIKLLFVPSKKIKK